MWTVQFRVPRQTNCFVEMTCASRQRQLPMQSYQTVHFRPCYVSIQRDTAGFLICAFLHSICSGNHCSYIKVVFSGVFMFIVRADHISYPTMTMYTWMDKKFSFNELLNIYV